MSELAKLLDQMFARESLEKNKYFLKHLDHQLNLPIVIIQKEHSLTKFSNEEILQALKQCRNCICKEGFVTLNIPPHTRTIIINEVSQSHAEFKAFLLEHFLKDVPCEIAFEGGCCRVIFQDDEVGLRFLDQAVNSTTHPLKAYVEPENVYQSLTKLNPQQYPPQYYYQYDNQMFQNLYIRKASDDSQHQPQAPPQAAQQPAPQSISKPYYPPRKQSGQERKKSDQVHVEEKKPKNTPKRDVQGSPSSGPYYVEKSSVQAPPPPKVQQSPYIEKKTPNSRKTSEQVYVPKHKNSKDIVVGSPIKRAQIVYKRETLVEMFKGVQFNIKCNPNLQKLNEGEKALLLRSTEVSLEVIRPTRKDSMGTPVSQGKPTPQQMAQKVKQQ